LLDTGVGRFRVGPHRGTTDVVMLAPVPGGPLSRPEAVRRALTELRAVGWSRAVTPALAPVEQEAYLANGFALRERLHLLERPVRLGDARSRPTPIGIRLGRAAPADRLPALEVDRLAFDRFWRLDERGLLEAVAATPTARFRIGQPVDQPREPGGEVVAYAITGRAGRRGYLQRLAVDPSYRRAGLATALITDATRWLARCGARTVVVNTQEHNAAALALYQHLGFVLQPGGLVVLEAELAPATTPGPP